MKKHIQILFLSAFCVLSSMHLIARNFDAQTFMVQSKSSSTYKLPSTLQNAAQTFDLNVELSSKAFLSHDKQLTLDKFPLSLQDRGSITVHEVPSCIDANTEFMVGYKRIPIPQVTTYVGSINNEKGSTVLISYANGDMFAWVSRANGETIVISPNDISSSSIRPHFIYNKQSLQSALQFPASACGTQEVNHGDKPTWEIEAAYAKRADHTLDNRMLEMQVIVETTTTFFTKIASKNETRAANYIVSLFNAVNTLYRRELNLNITIPFVQIWTEDSPDPYKNDGADTPALLNEVQNRWGKITTRQRDVVHCLDAMGNAQAGAGFVAGIANGIGALCSGSLSNAYSVTGVQKYTTLPAVGYVNDVTTASHELGHNMGSFHTHNCAQWKPALDSCLSSGDAYIGKISYSTETCNTGAPRPVPGSIMSYCDLTNSTSSVPFTFLPRVYTFLRANLESKTCITEVAQPQIKMIIPWGNKSFIAGKKTPIEWTSSKVSSVNIEFSTNAGTSWNEVATGIPAASPSMINGQGTYTWTIPSIATDNGRIRIVDMSNSSVNDTSWANFKIILPTLALTTNLDGKAFGQKEAQTIAWNKSNIDSVIVTFSSDNGSTWNIVKTVAGLQATVDMPDIEASKCWIRIANSDDQSLIAQTGPFSIGKEELSLVSPKGGETLCANKNFTLIWKYKNIAANKVLLQYSINSGAWQNIAPAIGIDPWIGVYSFKAPASPTDSLIVRALYKIDTTLYSSSAFIKISTDAGCVATDIQDNAAMMPTLSVSPNPLTNTSVHITVQSKADCHNATMFITSLSGTRIQTLSNDIQLHSGEQTFAYDLSAVASGQYFITMQCGTNSISIPLTIQR